MDLDLSDFEDVPQADVIIKDPSTGQPTSAVFTLAGPEHPKRKQIEFAKQRKMRSHLQKTGKLQFQDPEEDEADETDTLVACTLGWSGVKSKGADVPFSPQAARDIYTDGKRKWLRQQIATALNEREAFIKRSVAP